MNSTDEEGFQFRSQRNRTIALLVKADAYVANAKAGVLLSQGRYSF